MPPHGCFPAASPAPARLVHFLDMILPQMVPVQSPCQSRRRRFASSYRIAERYAKGEQRVWNIPSMRPSYFGPGQASCMLPLPGIINHFCCWLLPCSQIGPPSQFEREAGPPYDKQRIQMGLRSGNTVLLCFRSGVGHFQSVLIALTADLHTNKPWQGQHKFWKYVSPIRTYFAWLPEQLARTYCSAALDRRSDLPYGESAPLAGT